MPTLKERVAAGAAALDAVRPGWEREIDLDGLHFPGVTTCVLGQLYGGLRAGQQAVCLPDTGAGLVGFGFALPRHYGYAPVTRAWKRLIRARLEAE